MEERGLVDALRAWLVGRGLSLRALFWVTGGLAFLLSPQDFARAASGRSPVVTLARRRRLRN
jgi:hypothetical protein